MTIYDVAEKAGVSVSTVSRVLNGKKNISEAMRAKVQKVLDENHYTPNALAQGLANSSMKLIGILVRDIRNYHHVNIAYSIERELVQYGYACILCNTGESPEMQGAYLRMLAGRKVDGVIPVGSIFQDAHMKQEIMKYLPDTPIVMANGYLSLDHVYGVICDEYSAVKECVHHFAARGHRNIGFILDRVTPSNKEKKRGYVDGMRECGLPCEKSNLIYGAPATYEGGYDATGQLLAARPDITAILYTEDPVAMGGLKYCRARGIAVPDAMEIIGFNNSDLARTATPEMTSVDNQMQATGTEAARILNDVLHGIQRPRKIWLSANIEYRESSPR